MASHAQISQNNKFSISLQYLKKEMNDEVDFFDKHESFLQIDAMILMGDSPAFPKSPDSKFATSLQYKDNNNKLEMKLIICM